ncbi:MAG: hypothetical protein JWL77_7058 [Chthonomonadaceae bacterium]|nr:hypothetical protein [Chthonomonadaceae bacterium]
MTLPFSAWIRPNVDTRRDGRLTLRVRSTSGSRTFAGGKYLECKTWQPGSAGLVCQTAAGLRFALEVGPDFTVRRTPLGQSFGDVPLVTRDGTYVQTSPSEVDLISADGATQASFSIPRVNDDQAPAGTRSYATTVAGYAVTTDRAVLAFAWDGAAAQVTRLTDGTTVTISGFSVLGSPVVGRDGYLYVPAWLSAAGSTVRILQLDAASLKVIRVTDTHITTPGVDSIDLVPAPRHDLVIVVTTGTRRIQQTVMLLDRGTTRNVHVPAGTGLHAVADTRPDSLLMFGGPARNQVSRLDLLTGMVTRNIADLRATTGDYLMALPTP